jgi:hypothetical protein
VEDWISVALEEYKSLREESLQSMQHQHTTLAYGLAAIGAALFGGFQLTGKPYVLTFLFILPVLCYLILFIWMGEVTRMIRAGKYLVGLENIINDGINKLPGPLCWENSLRKIELGRITPQIKWNYKFIFGAYLALAFFSIIIGNLQNCNDLACRKLVLLDAVSIFVYVIVFLFIWHKADNLVAGK